MRSEYKKLKSIMKNKLKINSSEIHLNQNIATDFGFCDWEVEYFFAKVENEFNVNLGGINNDITVNYLLHQIQKTA